jgi:DNA-binding CsgD family transcriptional regulator
LSGSEYALFLALDGYREQSIGLTKEILELLGSCTVTGLYRIRATAIAKSLCALVEAINGRVTYADRVLRAVKADHDIVVALMVTATDSMLTRLRHRGDSGPDRFRDSVRELASLGYADLARLMAAVDRVLAFHQQEAGSRTSLTRSERDVLRLLAEGFSPKEIGARTERSVYTIRVHIANIMAKLGCHGRAAVIREAQRLNLL